MGEKLRAKARLPVPERNAKELKVLKDLDIEAKEYNRKVLIIQNAITTNVEAAFRYLRAKVGVNSTKLPEDGQILDKIAECHAEVVAFEKLLGNYYFDRREWDRSQGLKDVPADVEQIVADLDKLD